GEQQMLAIGRALMARPRLLMLDEPSLGLAPLVVREIFGILERINREQGTAVLLVEQNAHQALRLASHAYILENGQVVLDDASERLRENPDVREFYLGITDEARRKSYAKVKHYKRRKRWLS
ncbi:MAG: ABC transporter ATP-binding protein, partial [Candidatus Rokubacteria bacterium]|nr:ABC transporter ATP-binding protein [Candidatus Rokubacteria bacterium]